MVLRLPARGWQQLCVEPTKSTAITSFTRRPTRLTSLRLFSYSAARFAKLGWSTLPKHHKPWRWNVKTPDLPAPASGPAAALKRKENTTPKRTGILAIKKGMTAFLGRAGARIPCTVLQLDDVQTVANITREQQGYWAVQVGYGSRKPYNMTAPMLGYYESHGIHPKRALAEFRVRDKSGLLPIGVPLSPDWFHVGQWVDVRSNSRGMGFAGGMKRHGFAGQEASHGNSKNHRTIGTAGPSQGSGSRVMPGKKMPGRMGNERVTVQNLSVIMIDNELGIVVVKGCVAGPKGALVKIQDAVKKPPPPQEFIEKTRRVVQERFPHADQRREEALKKHLELKEARNEGRIAQLLG